MKSARFTKDGELADRETSIFSKKIYSIE